MNECPRCQYHLLYKFPYILCENCGFQEFTHFGPKKDDPEHLLDMRNALTEIGDIIKEIVVGHDLPEGLKEDLKRDYHFVIEQSEEYDNKLRGRKID